MKTELTTKKFITLLLILCFGWLVIGSIVNFHQVHVLGQNHPILDHQFIKPKSGDKKTPFAVTKDYKGFDKQDQPVDLLFSCYVTLPVLCPQELTFIPADKDLIVQSELRPSSLRAPPQA